MSRRAQAPVRHILPDPKFNNDMLAKFMNVVMKSGKKSLAERVVYEAIEQSRQGSDSVDPLETLNKAVENVKPRLETKSRRVGGATYQVPMEVAPARAVALAFRWIVNYASARKGSFKKALATELKEAALGQGNAIKKRDDTHKMAQANRAFAHFRF
ncbi:MAG: 30S ribosomal protein S7 [Gammaproteobacteria bacterium]|nr:30S ribosomal protein S7 [Gammaproteobacteria bacterium]